MARGGWRAPRAGAPSLPGSSSWRCRRAPGTRVRTAEQWPLRGLRALREGRGRAGRVSGHLRGLLGTREDSGVWGLSAFRPSRRGWLRGPLGLVSPSQEAVFGGLVVPGPLLPALSFARAQKAHYSLSWLVGWFGEVGSQEVYLASLLIWEPECVISLPWAS